MFTLFNIFIILSFVKGDFIPLLETNTNTTTINDDFLIVSLFWIIAIISCLCFICCDYSYQYYSLLKSHYFDNININIMI